MITKQAELAAINAIQLAIDREGLDWVAGETPISRLSLEDKHRLYNDKAGPPLAGISIESRPLYLQDVADPAYFDWRDVDGYDWMTSVRMQGTCGSCWAFSATGVIEAAFNIYSEDPDLNVDMSEQYLISCTDAGSCNGGWPDWALEKAKYGTVDEACFPYRGRDDINCIDNLCDDYKDRRLLITGYKAIESDTASFKWALQEYGAMCVVMQHPEDWFYYTSGVYKPTAGSVGDFDHAIVLVGWDDSLGDNGAWICKNSHGTGFGENGYALVDFGVLEGYYYAYVVTGVEGADPYIDERCTDPTEHFESGCALLLHYDGDNDGIITLHDVMDANNDKLYYIINDDEYAFVNYVYNAGGGIDDMCPGCHGEDENVSPIAIASAIPTSGKVPLAVQFTGHGTDQDGTIQSYNWNFGDGNVTNIQNPAHTYNTTGTYTPVLTVTDNDGAIGKDSRSILVTGEAVDPGMGGWIYPSSVVNTSSQYSDAYRPQYAIDGDRDTRWLSVSDDPQPYIVFDIGAQVSINSVRAIDYYLNVPTIYVSSDATNWTRVGSIETAYDNYGVAEFNEISARYVKLERLSGSGYFSCVEFQVFAPTGTGWFKPKCAIASSEYDADHASDRAIDNFFGKGTDCWFSDNEVPCWIRFDLGSQKTVDMIRLVAGTNPLPMTLVVEVSNDDLTWTPVTSNVVINESYTEVEIAIAQSTARYIRLNIVDANGVGGCCEFDVHVVDDTVANIEVVGFTVTPQTCQTPCNTAISITWENTGTATATFTPGYTVNGTLHESSSITLVPGQQGVLNENLSITNIGDYEICPVPN